MAISLQNLRNSSWSIANILLYPIAFMGLTPVFIQKMGEVNFGVWMLVNAYVYIAVSIISFGFSNSITAHVASALGRKDPGRLHGYINASTRILGLIALVTLAPAITAAFLIFCGIHLFSPSLGPVLVLATVLIAVKFLELLYQGILKGFERFDLAGGYNLLNKFGILAVQLVLALTSHGLMSFFLWNVVINALVVILQGITAYRLLPGYSFSLQKDPFISRELFIFGFWTWLQTVLSVVAYQADRFIIAWALGPAIAGFYILASTIANHMHMAFGAMAAWLFPKVARQKELKEDTLHYFHTLRGFTLGASWLVIIGMFLIYRPFFTLWIGAERFAMMDDFFAWFLAFEAFLVLTIVPLFYLNGIGRLKFITLLELMVKGAILAGMVVAFAIEKTGVSLIAGQVFALAAILPVEYLLINRHLLKSGRMGEGVVALVPSFCLAAIIIVNSPAVGLILTLVAGIAFWFYYMRRERFDYRILIA